MNSNQQIGQIGEDIACQFLKDKGYEIVERNFKNKWGEIDIIAQKNNVFHFCEVKTIHKRKNYLPEDEITGKKKQQLWKMAQIWLEHNKVPPETPSQIDIIAIELTNQGPEINYFPNAFEDIF